jgi:hypothetical protein
MKKTLIATLSTALVIGAASTTFAAANPFSDVPADSWAYDAVAQLAKDGVVDGYGDGTYRGDQSITRYEMAQMVARAMAKTDVSAADKAMIDKLAAEFSDELGNLGVRVAALEKKVDNVKWTGEVQYTYQSERHNKVSGHDEKTNLNEVLFRLEPTAQINEHWSAKARIDYATDMNSSQNATEAKLDRAWVQGEYDNLEVNLGKLAYTTALDQGMVFDDMVSGGQVTFGKVVKATVTAGRFNMKNNGDLLGEKTANFQSIELNSDPEKKFTVGGAYYHVSGDFQSATEFFGTPMSKTYNADSLNIWEVGMGYKFTSTLAMHAAYAKNTQGNVDGKFLKSYNVELDYKGAEQENKGSFGVWAAYRHLGNAAVIHPTYDAMNGGQKGWELGTAYTLDKNIVGTLRYFRGKDLQDTGDQDASRLFGRVEFFF